MRLIRGFNKGKNNVMSNRQKLNTSRRAFLKYGGLTALTVAVDLSLPLLYPSQSWLITSADPLDEIIIPGKNRLRVLNNRPLNAETPPHLLDDVITPNDRHFVRNNGLPHQIDATGWTLTVDGEVHNPLVIP